MGRGRTGLKSVEIRMSDHVSEFSNVLNGLKIGLKRLFVEDLLSLSA